MTDRELVRRHSDPTWCPVPFLLGLMIPGYWQAQWGQTTRSWALVGLAVSMFSVAVLSWGSLLALIMFAGAFLTHLGSVADAVWQRAFPGFARGVPTLSAALLMGLGVYGPLWSLGQNLAWSSGSLGPKGGSYLVNRLAFRTNEPERGDWICYHNPDADSMGVGRVVARAGDEVEWMADGLKIGQTLIDGIPHHDGRTQSLALSVPPGFVVVTPLKGSEIELSSAGLLLVEREAVVGRAWAQSYPLWSRRLFL
ncbi:MAG TPA: S26 family signal peptidase [Isosphaeraceae bacterium]|nr:S26 family signal peptidase [Isosphaeraceae bacterium]